jgi:hypothetical protein
MLARYPNWQYKRTSFVHHAKGGVAKRDPFRNAEIVMAVELRYCFCY